MMYKREERETDRKGGEKNCSTSETGFQSKEVLRTMSASHWQSNTHTHTLNHTHNHTHSHTHTHTHTHKHTHIQHQEKSNFL